MTRFAEFPVRRRGLVLGGFILLALWAGSGLFDLGFSFSIMPLLEANAESRAEVDRYLEELPPEDYDQLFTVTRGNVFDREALERLEAFRAAIEAMPEIEKVVALSNVEVADRGRLRPRIVPFIELVGEKNALEVAAEHPLLERRLISRDGCSTALLVIAAKEFRADDMQLLEILERRLPKLAEKDWRIRFIGDRVARRAMTAHMKSDLRTSLFFQALFFAILLPVIFRSFRGIVLPLTVVLVAEVICLGLLGHFGGTIGLIDLAVPGIIMMIAVCDSVHMMQRFEESLAAGLERREAVVDMLRHVGFACLQTSVTTAIGFLSLATARHQVVQSFGLLAALAVMISFVVVIILLPALLAVWPVKHAIRPRVPGVHLRGYGRSRHAFIGTVAVFGIALFGMSRMTIDSHWLEELPADEAIVQDLAWFEDNFAGIMVLDVRVEGDLTDPTNLAALTRFETAMAAEEGIGHAESPVDWIAEAAGAGRERGRGETLTPEQVEQGLTLLRLAGTKFPRHLIRPDFGAGRVVFRTRDDGTRRFFALRDRVDALGRDLPPGMKVEVAGFLEMAHESSRLIATTMLESFGLSLLAISLLIALIYRSWRIGLAAVIPNVMPIAIALGMNGYFDIPVRIGIVMIYSLGLGLAVDDSIHLTSRFLEERRQALARGLRGRLASREALHEALRSSGSALVTTSIVLTVGALCYLPSGFRSLHDVGVLLTTIVVTALVFDVFLLPHLLELATPKDDDGDASEKGRRA